MIAALEVLLYAELLGIPLSVLEVVFVTGVLHAVGTALFVVPQGLGVAEAASVYALGVLGYPPELGLALGLVRRARVIVFSAAAVVLHLIGQRRRIEPPAAMAVPATTPGPSATVSPAMRVTPTPVLPELVTDHRTRSA